MIYFALSSLDLVVPDQREAFFMLFVTPSLGNKEWN
jgi:hypothetical protein